MKEDLKLMNETIIGFIERLDVLNGMPENDDKTYNIVMLKNKFASAKGIIKQLNDYNTFD